jgi:radical SAM superfamily enzyme YgiQ (UPF0313 family)
MQSGMFLMWGYDGEDLSDIEATVEHVKSCDPDIFLTTVSYPIKGTPYFEQMSNRLVLSGEWRSTTDRDWKIRGRHSRGYYQLADRLLKGEVGLSRARRSNVSTDPDAVRAFEAEIAAARHGLKETAHEVEA